MFIKISAEWNKTIISLAIVLSLLLSIYVLSDPVGSSKLLFKLYDSLTVIFEPTYMYGSFSVLIFLIFIALSKYGDIKISLQNKETHSFFSWGSMLFAAGIGAALLYWATIEWIDYFNILRSQSLDIDTALLYSRTYPIFHWSFTAWAIYCLPAIAFGLAITINQ